MAGLKESAWARCLTAGGLDRTLTFGRRFTEQMPGGPKWPILCRVRCKTLDSSRQDPMECRLTWPISLLLFTIICLLEINNCLLCYSVILLNVFLSSEASQSHPVQRYVDHGDRTGNLVVGHSLTSLSGSCHISYLCRLGHSSRAVHRLSTTNYANIYILVILTCPHLYTIVTDGLTDANRVNYVA